jgi:phenylacetate-CoA ligase
LNAAGFPDRNSIEAHHLVKLQALLAALEPGNAFYSARLHEAGIGSGVASLQQFFERVPFTRKQDLIEDQRAHPPYGSNLTFPLDRYTRFWEQVFRAAGVTSWDRIFFAFSFGPFLGFWLAFETATRMGCLAIPGGGMRSSARLRTIIDTGATVLCCTPTYAIRLGEVAAEENIDLAAAKVRTILVAGEPGGSIAGTRSHIAKLWHGACVVDHHGMTEVGPVSYGCPARPGVLHVLEAGYIAEVIDPESGRAVGAGNTGELVLTNLGRVGSPLLRFRTGDLVERAAATVCACGSHELALEGGILARTDDMVVVRGVNVYPSAVEDILRACGVAEYRVEVRAYRTLPELNILVELPRPSEDGTGLAHRLEAALSSALALRIPVSCVPGGTLPRFEMKAQRWVRL